MDKQRSCFSAVFSAILLFFLTLPSSAQADLPPHQDIREQMRGLVQNIRSISANVRVESHHKNSNAPEIERYKIYVKDQNKVRREWSEDKKRRILEVIDGNTIWQVEKKQTVKRVNLSSRSPDEIQLLWVVKPLALLESTAVGTVSQLTAGNLKQLRYIGLEEVNGALCWHFEGRNQSFWVSSKDGSIRKSIGNKLGTPLIFHYYEDVVVNPSLDEQMFSYQPAPNTQVEEVTTKDGKQRTRRYRTDESGKESEEKSLSRTAGANLWQNLFSDASNGLNFTNATLLGEISRTSPAYHSDKALITSRDCKSALVDQGNGKIAFYEAGNQPKIFPPSGTYQKILDAKLSPNGRDYAFAVEAENWDQFVVANGKPGQVFSEIKYDSLTISETGSIAYVGKRTDQSRNTEVVVFNEALQEDYYAIHGVALSRDGSTVAYGAMKEVGEHYAVANGERLGRFAWVEKPLFGDSVNQLAYLAGQISRSRVRSVVVGDRVLPPYQAIYGLAFKGDTQEVFYAGHNEKNFYIHFGNEKWGPYVRRDRSQLIEPKIDQKGERISYEVTDGAGLSWIEQNGQQIGKRYRSVQNVGYHPNTAEHIFLAADQRSNRELNFIVINGEENSFSPGYDETGQKIISPKNRKLAYKIFNDAPLGGAYFGAAVLSFDGETKLVGRYASLSEVQLTSDESSFCFVAIVGDKLYSISERF